LAALPYFVTSSAKKSKNRALPTQAGFRPNDLHCSKKTGVNSNHPYEQRTITALQPTTKRCPPHSNGQLATENKKSRPQAGTAT